MLTQQCGQVIQGSGGQDERNAARCLVFAYERVLRQEMASFGVTLTQQFRVACSILRKQRIVTGRAQVAAQMTQHFVT